MGLTIHYNLSYSGRSADNARKRVEQMRQLALDLPFEKVGEIVDLEGNLDFESPEFKDDESLRWLLIQASTDAICPWNKHCSRIVNPCRLISFNTHPGWGSEALNIGLCLYPETIQWEYKPIEDTKFHRPRRDSDPLFSTPFNWNKWERHREKLQAEAGNDVYVPILPSAAEFIEQRTVKTRLGKKWTWGSLCKTQYASDPRCGGMANFVKCHVTVITFLEKVAQIPGIKVHIHDEGKYGPSHYSDDWREAREEGRQPTYVDHEGRYSVKDLIQECGEWNEMIAAFTGGLNDMLKASGSNFTSVAPIAEFNNFEYLEFKGRQRSDTISVFLKAMDQIAKANRQPVETE